MVLYINILILNPDEAMEKQAGRFSFFAKSMVDHDTLTGVIAEVIRHKAEAEMQQKGLDVDMRVRESHSLYCVLQLNVKTPPANVFALFAPCCETENAAIMLVEKGLAAAFPITLKSELKKEGIDADVVIVRDTDKQEQYEVKVLDLIYPEASHAHHEHDAGSSTEQYTTS
ncbi:unnamed protein product [Amoebophrya sp. A25]|nr:unnamed protein product [Amoebophrya sp. A25]|eukprot:GSA25T00016669001.1